MKKTLIIALIISSVLSLSSCTKMVLRGKGATQGTSSGGTGKPTITSDN